MSLAASLFHSTDTTVETLHRRITPTDKQFDDQKNRWNDLREFLKVELKAKTGYGIATWLQGSYKFDTQIRPWNMNAEFDIDLGLYFQWSGEPEDGDYEPEDLKALVQEALEAYQANPDNDATGVTDPKERCCRIRFAPDFHIDTPCYHLDPQRDARSLATESKGWEVSDPKAIYEWFKGKQPDALLRAKLRRTVRYLKMWSSLKIKEADRPSSILLTVLAAEAFDEIDLVQHVDDDDILEQVSGVIAARLRGSYVVLNPVNGLEDLNRLSHQQTEALEVDVRGLEAIAVRARVAGRRTVAAEIWAEAFDQFFPMPEDNGEDEQALVKGTAIALYGFDPRVEIVAVPRSNKNLSWGGTNEIRTLPKDCDISFRLANAYQLPPGATIKWTVRNKGDEAADRNDLGHIAGNTDTVERHTEYNGDHAMDVSVFLGSQLIGRRRIAVTVNGPAAPARNPPRRRIPGR
jgi:hypothetical protein